MDTFTAYDEAAIRLACLRNEWEQHGESVDVLAEMEAIKDLVVAHNESVLRQIVHRFRADGITWQQVGDGLAITEQAAQQRFEVTN